MNDVAIEVDPFTRAGHERFKETIRFKASIDGTRIDMTWTEWMEWQATRDPIAENPKVAEAVRERVDEMMAKDREARRGPGITRRTVPAQLGGRFDLGPARGKHDTRPEITKDQVAESSAKSEAADKGPAKVAKDKKP